MTKIDYRKELKYLYGPSPKKVEIVEVPQMNFLMIDGAGDPNTAESYQEAVEALFGLSYAIKFMIKKGKPQVDYGVLPLEGLWWADDMDQFSVDRKEDWKWTSMIMQPEYVTRALLEDAIAQIRKKKKANSPVGLERVRFESFCEGKAAQIMHIGPYADEAPTIERIHEFISEQGYELVGKHHEIYISDFRRTAPEKLKTVIRQPIE